MSRLSLMQEVKYSIPTAFGVSPSRVYLAKIFTDMVKSFSNLSAANSLSILFLAI